MRTLQARDLDKFIYPNWVLQPQKSALRIFLGKYLSSLRGLLHTPLLLTGGAHD